MSNIDLLKKAVKERRDPVFEVVSKPRASKFSDWEKAEYEKLKPRLRKLDVKLGKKGAHGRNIDIYSCAELEKIYGRKNLCLKVFSNSKSIWGIENSSAPTTIIESTIAQNLLAMKGICPRVYDLVSVGGKTVQVTEYPSGPAKSGVPVDSNFEFWEDPWNCGYNYVGGQMVDFEGTRLKSYGRYKRDLLKETSIRNEANGHCRGMYQSVDQHRGIRDTKERLDQYQFRGFKNKAILDIGCSNGMFCRAACDLGAKRVVGIDYPNMVEMAEKLAILDGYFNIDFYGADLKTLTREELKELTGIKRFNIHLFFAMENHVGWADWVKNCDTLYYEGHGQPRPFEVFNYKKQQKAKKGSKRARKKQ